MADRHAVDPAVVRSLAEYLAEREAGGDAQDAEDLLITFCREIYNQFFAGVIGVQLREPGNASRIEIIDLRKRKKADWPKPVDDVVHGYLKFCPLYDDLLSGLRYEQEDAQSLFHIGFVPKMLMEFLRWAGAARDLALVNALDPVVERYLEMVEEWKLVWDE